MNRKKGKVDDQVESFVVSILKLKRSKKNRGSPIKASSITYWAKLLTLFHNSVIREIF